MYIIYEGESLLIPAVVTGTKSLITDLTAVIKSSTRGQIPLDSDPVLGTFVAEDYTSAEVADGYLFKLSDTSALAPGIYYVNYQYTIDGLVFKGTPKRVTIKESVV